MIKYTSEVSDAPTLLLKFFDVYSTWNWPDPVSLTVQGATAVQQHLDAATVAAIDGSIWNPGSRHKMPILTCTYPAMNSAYNVGTPQLRRMVSEMGKAWNEVRKITKGGESDDWNNFFRERDGEFFASHRAFVEVRVTALGAEQHKAWTRWIERWVRVLAVDLEGGDCSGADKPTAAALEKDVRAYPHARSFRNNDDANGVVSSSLYVALKFGQGVEEIDLTAKGRPFLRRVRQFDGWMEGMDCEIRCVHGRGLEAPEARTGAAKELARRLRASRKWSGAAAAKEAAAKEAAAGVSTVEGSDAVMAVLAGVAEVEETVAIAKRKVETPQLVGHPFPKRKKREKYIHQI